MSVPSSWAKEEWWTLLANCKIIHGPTWGSNWSPYTWVERTEMNPASNTANSPSGSLRQMLAIKLLCHKHYTWTHTEYTLRWMCSLAENQDYWHHIKRINLWVWCYPTVSKKWGKQLDEGWQTRKDKNMYTLNKNSIITFQPSLIVKDI